MSTGPWTNHDVTNWNYTTLTTSSSRKTPELEQVKVSQCSSFYFSIRYAFTMVVCKTTFKLNNGKLGPSHSASDFSQRGANKSSGHEFPAVGLGTWQGNDELDRTFSTVRLTSTRQPWHRRRESSRGLHHPRPKVRLPPHRHSAALRDRGHCRSSHPQQRNPPIRNHRRDQVLG